MENGGGSPPREEGLTKVNLQLLGDSVERIQDILGSKDSLSDFGQPVRSTENVTDALDYLAATSGVESVASQVIAWLSKRGMAPAPPVSPVQTQPRHCPASPMTVKGSAKGISSESKYSDGIVQAKKTSKVERISFYPTTYVPAITTSDLIMTSVSAIAQIACFSLRFNGMPIDTTDMRVEDEGGLSMSPPGKEVEKALSAKLSTPWITQNCGRAAMLLTFTRGMTVDEFTFFTGEDNAAYDPVRWKFEGWSDTEKTWIMLQEQKQDHPVPLARGTQVSIPVRTAVVSKYRFTPMKPRGMVVHDGALCSWRTPRGTCWPADAIEDIAGTWQFLSNTEHHAPVEVALPLFLYSVQLYLRRVWAVWIPPAQLQDDSTRPGRWKVLSDGGSDLEEQLEQCMAEDRDCVLKFKRSWIKETWPSEMLGWEVPKRVRMMENTEEDNGLRIFGSGEVDKGRYFRLVRYVNFRQGDPHVSPLHDTIAWLPALDNEANFVINPRDLPPQGILEYVRSRDSSTTTAFDTWSLCPAISDKVEAVITQCMLADDQRQHNPFLFKEFEAVTAVSADAVSTKARDRIPAQLLTGLMKKKIEGIPEPSPAQLAAALDIQLLVWNDKRYLLGVTGPPPFLIADCKPSHNNDVISQGRKLTTARLKVPGVLSSIHISLNIASIDEGNGNVSISLIDSTGMTKATEEIYPDPEGTTCEFRKDDKLVDFASAGDVIAVAALHCEVKWYEVRLEMNTTYNHTYITPLMDSYGDQPYYILNQAMRNMQDGAQGATLHVHSPDLNTYRPMYGEYFVPPLMLKEESEEEEQKLDFLIQEGEAVEALRECGLGTTEWEPAIVKQVRDSGQYTVEWQDGENQAEDTLVAEDVRAPIVLKRTVPPHHEVWYDGLRWRFREAKEITHRMWREVREWQPISNREVKDGLKIGTFMLYQVRPLMYHLDRALEWLRCNADEIGKVTVGNHDIALRGGVKNYRGLADARLPREVYDVGRVVVWGAYSSSSLDRGVACHFAQGETTAAVFTLIGRSCLCVAPWSRFAREREWLYPPNTCFQVTAALSQEHQEILGKTHVQVFSMKEVTEREMQPMLVRALLTEAKTAGAATVVFQSVQALEADGVLDLSLQSPGLGEVPSTWQYMLTRAYNTENSPVSATAQWNEVQDREAAERLCNLWRRLAVDVGEDGVSGHWYAGVEVNGMWKENFTIHRADTQSVLIDVCNVLGLPRGLPLLMSVADELKLPCPTLSSIVYGLPGRGVKPLPNSVWIIPAKCDDERSRDFFQLRVERWGIWGISMSIRRCPARPGLAIGDAGGRMLAKIIRLGVSLHQLGLGNNNIGRETALELLDALRMNSHVVEVHLDGEIAMQDDGLPEEFPSLRVIQQALTMRALHHQGNGRLTAEQLAAFGPSWPEVAALALHDTCLPLFAIMHQFAKNIGSWRQEWWPKLCQYYRRYSPNNTTPAPYPDSLHRAAREGTEWVIAALIDDCKMDVGALVNGRTALHVAAEQKGFGMSEGGKMILRRLATSKDKRGKSVVDKPDSEHNRTALHLAAAAGRVEATIVLVECGANPNATDFDSATPLHLAMQAPGFGRSAKADLCIEHLSTTFSVNHEADDGCTPLHVASWSGLSNAVLKLISAGSDPQRPNRFGVSPLQLALESENPLTIHVLTPFTKANLPFRLNLLPLSYAFHKRSSMNRDTSKDIADLRYLTIISHIGTGPVANLFLAERLDDTLPPVALKRFLGSTTRRRFELLKAEVYRTYDNRCKYIVQCYGCFLSTNHEYETLTVLSDDTVCIRGKTSHLPKAGAEVALPDKGIWKVIKETQDKGVGTRGAVLQAQRCDPSNAPPSSIFGGIGDLCPGGTWQTSPPNGDEEGHVSVAFETIKGFTLAEILRRHGLLPESALKMIAWQVLHALLHLEHRSLTHGDLNLYNVMVTNEGCVKLKNIGLLCPSSMEADEETIDQLRALIGSLAWKAPERIITKQEGATHTCIESDVWALGLMIYQLATGNQPYEGLDRIAMLQEDPPFLPRHRKVPRTVVKEIADWEIIENFKKYFHSQTHYAGVREIGQVFTPVIRNGPNTVSISFTSLPKATRGFEENDFRVVFFNAETGEITSMGGAWSGQKETIYKFSENCQNFVSLCLKREVGERLKPSSFLKHPWFRLVTESLAKKTLEEWLCYGERKPDVETGTLECISSSMMDDPDLRKVRSEEDTSKLVVTESMRTIPSQPVEEFTLSSSYIPPVKIHNSAAFIAFWEQELARFIDHPAESFECPSLASNQRAVLHKLCDSMRLGHKSVGTDDNRRLCISKDINLSGRQGASILVMGVGESPTLGRVALEEHARQYALANLIFLDDEKRVVDECRRYALELTLKSPWTAKGDRDDWKRYLGKPCVCWKTHHDGSALVLFDTVTFLQWLPLSCFTPAYLKVVANGYPRRAEVTADKVPWHIKWHSYDPMEFNKPRDLSGSFDSDGLARSPSLGAKMPEEGVNGGSDHLGPSPPRRLQNRTRSHSPREYLYYEENCINPMGRTGLRGKGCFEHYGANNVAMPVITRRTADGNLQVLGCHPIDVPHLGERSEDDIGKMWLPSALCSRGETIPQSLRQAMLSEYDKGTIGVGGELQREGRGDLEAAIERASKLYTGFHLDPRNTDEAWVLLTVPHIHIDQDVAKHLAFAGTPSLSPKKKHGRKWTTLHWVPVSSSSIPAALEHQPFIRVALTRTASQPPASSAAVAAALLLVLYNTTFPEASSKRRTQVAGPRRDKHPKGTPISPGTGSPTTFTKISVTSRLITRTGSAVATPREESKSSWFGVGAPSTPSGR